MDPRISALSMVVGSYRWHSIKAVDLYFAVAGGFAFCDSFFLPLTAYFLLLTAYCLLLTPARVLARAQNHWWELPSYALVRVYRY
jgi:hypothetical protein